VTQQGTCPTRVAECMCAVCLLYFAVLDLAAHQPNIHTGA
jgi:hypothetical protein